MWTDHYLVFTSQEDYALSMPATWQDPASETHATDVVGTLFNHETGEANEGFHVNLRLQDGIELPAEIAVKRIPAPAFPKRVFA